MIIRRSISACFGTNALGGTARRPGTVVSMLALSVVALLGFLALAIDIGMLAIAKTQAQNAADLASLAAARTLNGNSSNTYNNSTATSNAQTTLGYNNILGQAIQSSQLTLAYGSYDYNQSTQLFNANYPATSGMPWTAVAVTVTSNNLPGAFSNVFGSQFLPSVSATAQAVHRPRDIAMIIDLSSSMRFGTLLGYDFWSPARTTNNPDTNVPTFAQYSGGNAATYLIGTSSNQTSAVDNYTISPTNTTVTNSSYSLTYINSFYQNAAYASTLIRAFDSYTSTSGGQSWTAPTGGATPTLPSGTTYASTPGGDVPLYNSAGTSYAQTLNQVLGNASTNTGAGSAQGYNILWELDGYSAYASGKPDTSGTKSTPQVWAQADYSAPASPPKNGSLPFNGYTQGPGYYGKTFFLWPPDPRNSQGTVGTTALTGTTLQNYLAALGISSTKQGTQTQTDAVTLANAWSTWQGNGSSGLIYLQTWLTTSPATSGTVTINGVAYNKPAFNYSATASPLVYVPTTPGNGTTQTAPGSGYWSGSWNGTPVAAANLPATYYAVCRLFNRAYPCGAAWTSTSVSADWRVRFFGTDNDNTVIFNSSGSINPPGTSGMWPSASSSAASTLLTYNAILQWLNQSPNPFPAMLRSGRIKYYGTMPSGSTTIGNGVTITGTWPSYGSTDQRFWVEVIDHMLGFRQTASASYTDLTGNQSSTNQMIGYGGDITWGTKATNAIPSVSSPTLPCYINYKDNPLRPLLRMWFSPILMVDYMQNCNMYYAATSGYAASGYFEMGPGNSYEAPLYVQKEAFLAAVTTMQNNHPNDWFTIIPYSAPRTSSTDTVGRLNSAFCPLGTNYAYASSAILFPFSTINADGSCNSTEVTPYDADASTGAVPSSNFMDTPRSEGYTCFAMGLMLAYNHFAVTPTTDTTLRTFVTNSPITFPTGMAGGLGRKGAQKLIIFETDGLADCTASATLTSAGSYNYYPIQYNMNNPAGSNYPTGVAFTDINNSSTLSQVYSLCTQLATTYGTTRNPFRLYAIGFGPVFSGADATTATQTLYTMQNNANGTSLTSLPSNQIITGTDSQMSANIISAYTNILESGVQIALIK